MMPGETDILTENEFAIITDVAAGRQRLFRFRPKIWAFTSGQTKIPGLVWAETDAPAKGRMFETNLRDVP